MSIKPKSGKCMDCPSEGSKYLMAGRCMVGPHFHYQNHKSKQYAERSANKVKQKNTKLSTQVNGITLGQWFNQQINQMPRECENCGNYLNPYARWSARAYIAHIVPKRHFISVCTNPHNRMFLCIDCHSNYDNWLMKDVMRMPCWPIAVERFNRFKNVIDVAELKHLREPFTLLLSEK